MDLSERISELKSLEEHSSGILNSEHTFNKWHGKVSGLLGFDQAKQKEFDRIGNYILERHEFHRNMIGQDIVKAESMLIAILTRAISNLEANHQEPAPGTAAQAELQKRNEEQKTVDPLTPPMNLSDEHDLLWYWHHSTFRIKWFLVGSAVTAAAAIFFAGFLAGQNDLIQKLWKVFETTYSQENHSTPTTPGPNSTNTHGP